MGYLKMYAAVASDIVVMQSKSWVAADLCFPA